eukprot:TRINITY_DN9958_c0_g1_i2.p1 TRINITY_DN9958_c0_g1~~TRINITY_DN9958_c0_g1_i2.p1  ORF type:complete len:406 (-),score=39.52 TRINITY_DN9958_c0_g1_i2:350-1567(-)
MFRQRLNGQVSDLCMTCPGPSQPLDLESHIAFEASLKSAPQAGSQVEVTPRLSEFIEARDAYWKSKNGPPRTHSSSAKWMQRDPSRRKPNQGLSGAVYTVSPDGCWVMETFGSPADMCYVTDRYIFNLWTYKQLLEAHMQPWSSLSPAKKAQSYDKWEGDSASNGTQCCELLRPPQATISVRSSPNLHHNVGCHDESDDENPRPDYESGCKRVSFYEVELTNTRNLSSKVQVVRASRFGNTFDKTGSHWIYVLPSSPLESAVGSCCLQKGLPDAVANNLWELSRSWPATAAKAASQDDKGTPPVAMTIDPRWPYSVLRARQHARIPAYTEAATDDVVAIIPRDALDTFVFYIDLAKSTSDFWKLAPRTKDALVDAGYVRKTFLADEEGFITKLYEDRNTLVEVQE